MTERRFSKKCGKCRERAVELATVRYATTAAHDGRDYAISIPALVAPRCASCGTIALDEDANRRISAAIRQAVGLLTPEQIRSNRLELGLTQESLAESLGIAVSTLSRWESGGQIQQRCLDRFLRSFFKLPELRQALASESSLRLPEASATA